MFESETSLVNYNFYIAATDENLNDCIQVENVAGIKLFMGSSTGNMLVDDPDVLNLLFQNANKLIAVHSEDESIIAHNMAQFKESHDVSDHMRIRSTDAAMVCTKRACELAQKYQQRLHILHVTTDAETMFLAKSNLKPLITSEVCVHHLLLDDSEYERLGTLVQVNPPIRSKTHQNVLWNGLLTGTIDMVVTDHAPHTLSEKLLPFGQAPSGMPGVDTALSLMLTQVNQRRCSLNQLVNWMSVAPAKLYGIPQKGVIAKGMDADLVLVDMKSTHTIDQSTLHTKCGWSAFDGQTVQGLPLMTIVNGQMVYREKDFFDDIKGQEVDVRIGNVTREL